MNTTLWLPTNLYEYLAHQTQEAGQQITLFGIVMAINFPLFGILWKFDFSQNIEEFVLRMVATLFCMLLAIHHYWPSRFKRFLPIWWYLTLLFCLPFFFTYMTLINHGATLWLMNCISAMFFLLIVADVVDSIVVMTIGIGGAFILYFSHISTRIEYIPGDVSFFGLVITFSAAIIIGSLFARDKEIILAGKLSGMRLMAGSLAHDLRTPLASIHLQAEMQENLLQQVKNPRVKKDLRANLDKIAQGISMGNQVISMQLNNILREKFDTKNFSLYSIKALIESTLKDYPLNQLQEQLISTTLDDSYCVWVEKIAFKNLLWNLLNNSLGFIEQCNKGEITITITQGRENDDFNYLFFKDTAKGLSASSADKLFDFLYSEKEKSKGKGIGLAYCRLFMQAAGGSIGCKGKEGQHILFTMKFPKVD